MELGGGALKKIICQKLRFFCIFSGANHLPFFCPVSPFSFFALCDSPVPGPEGDATGPRLPVRHHEVRPSARDYHHHRGMGFIGNAQFRGHCVRFSVDDNGSWRGDRRNRFSILFSDLFARRDRGPSRGWLQSRGNPSGPGAITLAARRFGRAPQPYPYAHPSFPE